jgi:hypothetical protein
MDTIWFATVLLINGHVVIDRPVDPVSCRKAEIYTHMGKPFSVNSDHGPIPVIKATCRRVEACHDTGERLALLTSE